MGEAYTPGLQVSEATIVRKQRTLPIPGEVLVKRGELVTANTIIARALMPGPIEIVKVSDTLRVTPSEMVSCLKKNVGDMVKKGELLAERSSFFGLFRKECRCPTNGTIEYISYTVGQVHIRGPPVPIDVKAYIPGKVAEVLPKEGAIIETPACFIQGIFGIGGEKHGEISVAVDSPDEVLSEDKILPDHSGKIIVGGSLVTSEALRKASEESVKGIIIGGIDDKTLIDFLGYDIGVAITGHENINTTLIVTEGFGKMTMAERIFDLLKKHNGEQASINGATQIRAGVIRPEIVIPLSKLRAYTKKKLEKIDATSKLEIGTYVRVIRGPHFGAFGHIIDLPAELQQIQTESKTIVVKVQLEDGMKVVLPRANVEIIK